MLGAKLEEPWPLAPPKSAYDWLEFNTCGYKHANIQTKISWLLFVAHGVYSAVA